MSAPKPASLSKRSHLDRRSNTSACSTVDAGRTRSGTVRPEDVPVDVCHADFEGGVRRSHGPTLDGAQIAGNDDAFNGSTSQRRSKRRRQWRRSIEPRRHAFSTRDLDWLNRMFGFGAVTLPSGSGNRSRPGNCSESLSRMFPRCCEASFAKVVHLYWSDISFELQTAHYNISRLSPFG